MDLCWAVRRQPATDDPADPAAPVVCAEAELNAAFVRAHPVDVVIDFSSACAVRHYPMLAREGCRIVSAISRYEPEQQQVLADLQVHYVKASGDTAPKVFKLATLDMAPGASAEIPENYSERAIYIATGAVEVQGRRVESGRMLVLGASVSRVRALEQTCVMLLGGESVGPKHLYWNFVSSSKERIAEAASQWAEGKMKLPDADDIEFIPLPAEPI